MNNRRGQALNVFIVGILIIAAIVLLFYITTGKFIPDILEPGVDRPNAGSVQEETKNVESFGQIFNERAAFLDYFFGKVPSLLQYWTSPISAAIIVIGIWFLLLFTFADITSVFGTFNKWTAWVIALVLAIIAGNIKLIIWISIIMLIVTAGLGAISVFVSLILIFVIFVAFNYGAEWARTLLVTRKEQELRIRAAMGSARAKAGLETLSTIGARAAREGSKGYSAN